MAEMEDFYTLGAAVLGVILYLIYANWSSKDSKPEIIPPPKVLIPIPEEYERPQEEEEVEEDAADILAVNNTSSKSMTMSELLTRLRNPNKELDDPSKRVSVKSSDMPINQPKLDLSLMDDFNVNKENFEPEQDFEQYDDRADTFAKMMLNPESLRDAIIVSELINKKY